MDRRSCPASAGDELVPSEVGERPYRPVLKKAGLTQAVAFDPVDAADKSAAAATSVDGRQALPAIVLRANGETWRPQRDLLASDRFAPEFVVRPRSMVVAIHGRICASAMACSVGSLPRARGSTASIDLASARLATSALDALTQMKPAVPGVESTERAACAWRCRPRTNATGPAGCPSGVSRAGARRHRGRLRGRRATASRRAARRLHTAVDGDVPHDVHHRRPSWRQAGDARVRTGAARLSRALSHGGLRPRDRWTALRGVGPRLERVRDARLFPREREAGAPRRLQHARAASTARAASFTRTTTRSDSPSI